MFTNYSKIPIKLAILLVGFGLLVVGCDSAGVKKKPNKNKVDEKIAFEAVDGNLGSRVTTVGGSDSKSMTAAAQKSVPGFTITHRVSPPNVVNNNPESASDIALSQKPSSTPRNLYIGYKVAGSGYGGGIDILDADGGLSNATQSSGDANTLQSSAVDVQELGIRHSNGNPSAIYAATAVDPDVTVPRAPQLQSIDVYTTDGLAASSVNNDLVELLNSESNQQPTTQPTRVAKSLVVDDQGNSNGDVFAVSDENTAHGLPIDGSDNYTIDENSMATVEVGTGRSYRSITQGTAGNLFALGFDGNIYELNFGSTSESQVTSSPLGTISNEGNDNENSIARLSVHHFPHGQPVFLVALNEGGFSVYDPGNGEVYSDPDTYATSVTATDNYVYVASGSGIAVYRVGSSGLGNTNANDGLEYIGTQPLDELNGGPAANDVQINDIVVDPNSSGGSDNVLFVAKSTDGVYRLEQNGSAWNP